MGNLDVLAGIIGSDGHIYGNLLSVCVVNKNLPFIEKVVIPLFREITGKNPKPKFVPAGFGNGKYKVTVSSVKFNKTLMDKYNIPPGAKSRTIKPPKLSELDEKIDFLRGWISGDGSVTRDRTRAKIEIWSKSLKILNWFKDVLLTMGINSRLFEERNKREYILRIGRKDDVELFYRKVKIPHPKKQEKMESFFS